MRNVRTVSKMNKRKKIIIVGVLFAVIAVVALLVGAYPTVVVANISATLEVTHSSPYDVTARNVEIKITKMSYVGYAFSAKQSVREREKTDINIVDLEVKFLLKTPTGSNLTIGQFDLAGRGFKDFNLIVGPNEGLREDGTFTLFIEMHLKVNPPAGPSIDLRKTIERTFKVP